MGGWVDLGMVKRIQILLLLIGTLFSQNYDLKQYITSSSAFSAYNSQQRLTGTLGQSITGEIQNE